MLINCLTLSETMGYMRRQDCLGANSQYVKRKQVRACTPNVRDLLRWRATVLIWSRFPTVLMNLN